MRIMIKKLLLTLVMTASVFGQYVAPNEDTVIVCGGLGTMANANDLNGGGATKTVWDAGAPTDFIGANGGPITADTGITYDHTGNGNGERNFAKAGIGTGVTIGTLAYCSGTNITTGIYEVTSVDGGGAWICCNEIVASGDNADSVVNVGGAFASIQGAFDNAVMSALLYDRNLYINGIQSDADGTIAVGTQLDIDTWVGDASNMAIVVGYNATLAAESQVTLQATASINAIIAVGTGADTYWLIRNFTFDAEGAGKANYCVYGTGASDDRLFFEGCIFQEAIDNGAVLMNGDGWSFINCEVKESTFGIATGGTDGIANHYISCSIHDNAGDGIHQEGGLCWVINCIIYDNGDDGYVQTVGNGAGIVMGNTFYINDGDNVDYSSANPINSFFINNASVGSTGGYGYNLNGLVSPETILFGNNLSAGNNSGHTDISGTFADLGIGGNIASAQAAAAIFTNVTDGAEDFTPKAGSDLIDNALDAGTN